MSTAGRNQVTSTRTGRCILSESATMSRRRIVAEKEVWRSFSQQRQQTFDVNDESRIQAFIKPY